MEVLFHFSLNQFFGLADLQKLHGSGSLSRFILFFVKQLAIWIHVWPQVLLPQQLLSSVGLLVLLLLPLLLLLQPLLPLPQVLVPLDLQGLLSQLDLPALFVPLSCQALLLLLLLVSRLHVMRLGWFLLLQLGLPVRLLVCVLTDYTEKKCVRAQLLSVHLWKISLRSDGVV